ncbi:MAG: class I SAM-dependent methyltransferase [Bacteroidota bacterium]
MEDQLKAISQGHTIIFKQKSVPVFQNKVFVTENEAMKAVVGEVELARSNQTGFIFNKRFDNNLMNYDANYHNEQSNSLIFKEHLQNVFELIKKRDLKNKKVIEIGCGKAHFFNILEENKINCVGFDPAYEGNNPSIVKDYFSNKYEINGDLILLRHTLEHIENPHTFIGEIAKANNYKGHIFIEVPTFDWIYKKQAFWDIFYEHCNYFTEKTLSSMFNKAETGSLFGEQYIYCYAALKDLKPTIEKQHFKAVENISFESSILKWTEFLNKKRNIAIWGAGAKGSTFLNLLDSKKEKVKFVIDINPEKQNKFVAYTGHPIYSPKVLENNNIENIVVMNENYIFEIKQLINNPTINLYSL